jgi:hypothetical protein
LAVSVNIWQYKTYLGRLFCNADYSWCCFATQEGTKWKNKNISLTGFAAVLTAWDKIMDRQTYKKTHSNVHRVAPETENKIHDENERSKEDEKRGKRMRAQYSARDSKREK